MAPRKRNDRGSPSNAGTVFWLAAIVIVLFIFALNWGKIQETLARTNFHEIVKTQTGSDKPGPAPSSPQGSPAGPGSPAESPAITPNSSPQASSQGGDKGTPTAPPPGAPLPKDSGRKAASPPEQGGSAEKSPSAKPPQDSKSPAELPKSAVSAPLPKTRAATLYFVRIDDDGVIVRQEVKRQISVSDSPLLDSLGALLQGPTEDELRRKLISLVPQGTKLLSAQVRGSTAYLNFNEAFMYNHYGIEGYAGQLKQVVYTSTAFPTVQDVQILIEGAKHDYLGGEGVFIGRPLSRNSF
jgi:germination protein M